MVLCSSCEKERQGTTLGGWELTGAPSDSVLNRLDSAILSYESDDTIKILSDAYIQCLTAEDPHGEYRYRIPFIEGTTLFMYGDFERGDSLRRVGIEECDSAHHPQDYAVMQLAVEEPGESADAISEYIRLSESLEGFLKVGDNVNSATRAVQLSGLFAEADLGFKALAYTQMADSLLGCCALPHLRNNYRINLASAYLAAADTANALRILDEVVQSPYIKKDPIIKGIISFNKSEITGADVDLLKAWQEIKDIDALARFQGLVAAQLINNGLITDSLRRALSEASEYAYLPDQELTLAQARLRLKMADNPNAYVPYDSLIDVYINHVNDYIGGYKNGKLAALTFQGEINALEAERRSQALEDKITLVICVALLILLILVIVVYYRKRLRDAERLAMLRTIEAKNAFRHDALSRAEQQDSLEDFSAAFAREYPRVSKTGRKIAALIRQGKDVGEVAMALNIRKESVLQARWRLRTQMELKPEDDLDAVILSFLRKAD